MANPTIRRMVGGALLLSGLTLVLPGVASAAATSTATTRPLVAVAPTVLSHGRAVSIFGFRLPPGGVGEISQCSSIAPQPEVRFHGVLTPVSCSQPYRVHFGRDGTLSRVRFKVVVGTVGPPASGIDSAGNPAAADAHSYPCPPTATQTSAGAHCYVQLRWGTAAGQTTVRPLTFVSSSRDSARSPRSSHSAAVITVKPHTDLRNDQTVEVTASGLPHGGEGGIIECSSAPSQPTISVGGASTPVSCTDPRAKRWTFTAHGDLEATFKIVEGTVGPPISGTDSSGKPAAAAAEKYPCPPTSAQVSSGAHCYVELEWGTGAADRAAQPIAFASSNSKGTTTTTTTSTSTSTTTSTTTTTTASSTTTSTTASTGSSSGASGSSGSTSTGLPFTGAYIEQTALVGGILVVMGVGLLLTGQSRRRRTRRSAKVVDTR